MTSSGAKSAFSSVRKPAEILCLLRVIRAFSAADAIDQQAGAKNGTGVTTKSTEATEVTEQGATVWLPPIPQMTQIAQMDRE